MAKAVQNHNEITYFNLEFRIYRIYITVSYRTSNLPDRKHDLISAVSPFTPAGTVGAGRYT